MKRAKLLALPAVAGLVVPLLAGCGTSGGDGGGNPIVMGSTDSIGTLDPAGAYDIGSWTLFTNTFQTLLRYPGDGSPPKPEAAKNCEFTSQNSTSYRCTVRSGLKFSNGDPLTASDVRFSIERMLAIADKLGPAGLFSNVDRVETPDDQTVVFQLKQPDATFPFVLATPAASIVDQDVYPARKLLQKDEIAGSGPYSLKAVQRDHGAHNRAVKLDFAANGHYKGGIELKNHNFEVRYFRSSDTMVKQLEAGKIDVIHRALTPKQITSLDNGASKGVELTEAPGTEIRYLVFNTDDKTAGNAAVRKAVARVVDRQALVRDVYQRTSEPLYSMIPQGIAGHINAFYNLYGDPDRNAARSLLEQANVSLPVHLTLTYTSDHYGAATADEFAELKKELEATGLFKIKIQGKEWEDFQKGYSNRDYQVFGMGWFPDFPDPDNYIAPFLMKGNFLNQPYTNKTISDDLIPDERRQAQRSAAVEDFNKAQNLIAQNAPLIPLWQGKQYIAHRDDIDGVQWTLDASSMFRFWEIDRGA